MERRHFLGAAVASVLPTRARADDTQEAFLANSPTQPRLAALANCALEHLSGTAIVQGRWPAGLRGTFYRNGPARFERDGERYHHWFDGDGMVQAWQVGPGGVRHEARVVRTRKYTEESAAGRFLYPAFDTAILRRPVANNDTLNTANTNVVPHAGRLYALWEGGSATELDPASLATLGTRTWRDDLAAMPFSAHPRTTSDGTLWNFGVSPGADKLLLWRVEPDGRLGRFGMVDVPRLPFVHDFVLTARCMVFLVPPFNVSASPHTTLMRDQVWDGARPLRAVVIDKADFTLRRVIDMPAGMVFHFGNGWDDGDTVRFDACLAADDSALTALEGAMRGETRPEAATNSVLVTLDLVRGTARQETMLADTEFPRVLAEEVGHRTRQVFVTTRGGSAGFGMTGVARIDIDSGRVDRFEYGPDWVVEEHVPVPRGSGKAPWLLGVAYDVQRRRTLLAVFDGAHVSHGPVAQARLPYAAPLCFHGNFLAAAPL